jgi:NAD(P)-dependent dehydrogenase (short-subunit alcohol dehydrogenase family)
MDWRGRKVLVTGGHKRLGQAVALDLAQRGCHVAIQWRSDEAEALETVAALRDFGVAAHAFQAELSDSAAVARLVTAAAAAMNGLDLAVAAAASWEPSDVDHLAAADLDRALQTNARAPIDLVLRCLPYLRASPDGRAVLFGDLGGITPYRGYLAHSMAKAALHAGVKALAGEVAPKVVVNAVVPGAVLRPADDAPEAWERLQRSVPLGAFAVADPTEPVRAVTEAVAWLASCPRYVTGQLLIVDGGRNARW